MRNKEIWKDIPGYEGYYEVSNLGNVRSKERKIMRSNNRPYKVTKTQKRKVRLNSVGYNDINLNRNGKYKTFTVHKLVAMAFLNNKENKPQINHKDGVKTNNRLENLEWVTPSENIQHSIINGFTKTKLSSQTVKKLKNFYERGMPAKLLSKMLGVNSGQINRVLTGKAWRYVK